MLELSTSGYYAWLKRAPSARSRASGELVERMKQIHRFSRDTYGRPRMYAELRAEGEAVKPQARRPPHARGGPRRRHPAEEVAPPTVREQGCQARTGPGFSKLCRHRACSALGRRITYIPTGSGFLYLSVVVDTWSRHVVVWSMETHLRTDRVLRALNMALGQRRTTSVIHDSDHGTQYTSSAFGIRCKEAGVRPSMGSVGDAYDCDLPGTSFQVPPSGGV